MCASQGKLKAPAPGNPAEIVEGLILRMRAPAWGQEPGSSHGPFPSKLVFAAGCLIVACLVFAALSLLQPGLSLSHTAASAASRPEPVPLQHIVTRPVSGLLQFRGNSTRTYYGQGPVPREPRLLWRFPGRPMCSLSPVPGNESKTWCGTGWTGQPVVWERPDGVTEVIFGAYDRAVHFVDLRDGRRTRPDFRTNDIVKGSVTLDPDGDPLLYFGSRDNKLRILALDRHRPTELWHLNANFVPGIWNNDWDGNPLVIDDVLWEGGENGYLVGIQLHRDYDLSGLVKVRPELLVAIRGWNADLIDKVGDRNVSIESSVAAFGERIYFANSAGRVVGLDISRVNRGLAPVVFDFWMGDDVDASLVIDDEGMLYVAAELERYLPRADEIGQLVKLDPYRKGDPLVWSLGVPPGLTDWKGGIWSTPALDDEVLWVVANSGLLASVDRHSGEILATRDLGHHAWSSPVTVDEYLIVTTCKGEIRNYLVEDPAEPVLVWSVRIPTHACIESTPAVWDGHILVGARDGFFYAFGD